MWTNYAVNFALRGYRLHKLESRDWKGSRCPGGPRLLQALQLARTPLVPAPSLETDLFQTDGGVSWAGWKQRPPREFPSSGRRSAWRRGSGGASSSPPSSPSSLASSPSFLFVFFKLLCAKRFLSFSILIYQIPDYILSMSKGCHPEENLCKREVT